MWSDGSSYSYNPGWVGSQPTTNTNQVIVIMITRFDDCGEDDDGVGCGFRSVLRNTPCIHQELIFRTALCFGTRGRTSGSGSTSAAARLSATTSTLSARGKPSADTTTTLVGLGRNRDNNSNNNNNMSDINIRHNNIRDDDINDNDIDIDTDIECQHQRCVQEEESVRQ